MNNLRGFALVLIVAGVLALVYGGFTYTKKTHQTKIGPIELAVKEKEDRQRAALGRRRSDRGRRGSALRAPEGLSALPRGIRSA